MKDINKNDFFDVLIKNDPSEMMDYLLAKGKEPKPICPIEFVKEENNSDTD